MVTPRKLDVQIAFFPYGGNGGTAAEVPQTKHWLVETVIKTKSDPRIGHIGAADYIDTPITMTRNRAVQEARKAGFDLLVMVDSDNFPDLYVGRQPEAVPFWETAFDAIYDHYERGPLIVAAPYGGPPPNEEPYVFRWADGETGGADEHDMKLAMFSRAEAAQASGLHPVAALATGLIMLDLRVFDYLSPPYFYYEWTDKFEQRKASTEDVTFTRDASFAVWAALGYNPLRCAFSSWAGHWKPKCVGKPNLLTVESVGERLREAMLRGVSRHDRLAHVDFTQHVNGNNRIVSPSIK